MPTGATPVMRAKEGHVLISFALDQDHVNTLRSAFPEQNDIQQVATKVAEFLTRNFVDLLAGKKRYLSLSHQYIEWLDQLYQAILPGEEFTYRRLSDKFNFPPGAAAYMARVLRARQNTHLHERAKEGLRKKLSREVADYDAVPPKERQPTQRMRSFRLTAREHDLLQTVVDVLIASEKAVDLPTVTSRTREYVSVTYHIDHIRLASQEVEKL